MPSGIIEMLDEVSSNSSRFSQRGKLDSILRALPEEEAEAIHHKIAEKDVHGYWIRPHAAVAKVFQDAGYPQVTKSTIERYRDRLSND